MGAQICVAIAGVNALRSASFSRRRSFCLLLLFIFKSWDPMKKLLAIAAAVAAITVPQVVRAESDVNLAAGPTTTATARLDFQIVIPRVLFLQVGTGTSLADNTAIDMISFNVPAANLGNGTDVAGTGGNLTGGAVTVRVFGNNGNIGLTAATNGALTNGAAGDTIPWSEIKVTSSAPTTPATGYLATAIAHPAIPATGTGAATTITATNKVVRQEGIWTFAYDNSAPYAAGTYGGAGPASPNNTGLNNGRILYTATLP